MNRVKFPAYLASALSCMLLISCGGGSGGGGSGGSTTTAQTFSVEVTSLDVSRLDNNQDVATQGNIGSGAVVTLE